MSWWLTAAIRWRPVRVGAVPTTAFRLLRWERHNGVALKQASAAAAALIVGCQSTGIRDVSIARSCELLHVHRLTLSPCDLTVTATADEALPDTEGGQVSVLNPLLNVRPPLDLVAVDHAHVACAPSFHVQRMLQLL